VWSHKCIWWYCCWHGTCLELLKLAVTHSLGQPIPILFISRLTPKRYILISEKLNKKTLWYGKIHNSCHFLFMTCRLLDDISVVLTNHPNTKQSFPYYLQCGLQLCVQVFRGSLRYIEEDMFNYLNIIHTNMYTFLVQVYVIIMIKSL
jgi:hypothetical protein